MPKKLKTLGEANHDAFLRSREATGPRPNGISCPQCKTELMDTDPAVILTSNPAQTKIHCPKCSFRNYRTI